MEHILYYEHLMHIKNIYFLKAQGLKILLVSRLKQMKQGVQIIQGGTLK